MKAPGTFHLLAVAALILASCGSKPKLSPYYHASTVGDKTILHYGAQGLFKAVRVRRGDGEWLAREGGDLEKGVLVFDALDGDEEIVFTAGDGYSLPVAKRSQQLLVSQAAPNDRLLSASDWLELDSDGPLGLSSEHRILITMSHRRGSQPDRFDVSTDEFQQVVGGAVAELLGNRALFVPRAEVDELLDHIWEIRGDGDSELPAYLNATALFDLELVTFADTKHKAALSLRVFNLVEPKPDEKGWGRWYGPRLLHQDMATMSNYVPLAPAQGEQPTFALNWDRLLAATGEVLNSLQRDPEWQDHADEGPDWKSKLEGEVDRDRVHELLFPSEDTTDAGAEEPDLVVDDQAQSGNAADADPANDPPGTRMDDPASATTPEGGNESSVGPGEGEAPGGDDSAGDSSLPQSTEGSGQTLSR